MALKHFWPKVTTLSAALPTFSAASAQRSPRRETSVQETTQPSLSTTPNTRPGISFFARSVSARSSASGIGDSPWGIRRKCFCIQSDFPLTKAFTQTSDTFRGQRTSTCPSGAICIAIVRRRLRMIRYSIWLPPNKKWLA